MLFVPVVLRVSGEALQPLDAAAVGSAPGVGERLASVERSAAVPLQRVGRYLLAAPLASGGMGSVQLALQLGDAGFERVVAIKRMHRELSMRPEFVMMFRDEIRLSCQVQHPNVVAALDVVEDRNELLLVMDYVHGESLAEVLRVASFRCERLPPEVAGSILMGLLQGLHAAHEASAPSGEKLELIHRDVSPENVLVGRDGYTRLADFGIAKAVGRLQQTSVGQLKGKLSYLAPERLLGRTVDRRCDVYSAAVVLWEALAGTSLFEGESDAEVIVKVTSRPLPSLELAVPGISASLQELVEKGLSLDPADRFATAREMALALESELRPLSPWQLAEWLADFARHSLHTKSNHIKDLLLAGHGAAEREPPPGEPQPLEAPVPLAAASAPDSDARPKPKSQPELTVAHEATIRAYPSFSRTPVRPFLLAASVLALVCASALALRSLAFVPELAPASPSAEPATKSNTSPLRAELARPEKTPESARRPLPVAAIPEPLLAGKKAVENPQPAPPLSSVASSGTTPSAPPAGALAPVPGGAAANDSRTSGARARVGGSNKQTRSSAPASSTRGRAVTTSTRAKKVLIDDGF